MAGKIIKNIGIVLAKLIGGILELSLFLIIVFFFMIRVGWFQTYLAHAIASYYSYQLGTEVSVEKLKINNFEYCEIQGLFIKDLKGDTLIYSPKLSGGLSMLSLESKFAILEAINSENARIKIQKYHGDSLLNIDFLVDYFASEEPSESNFKVKVNEINFHNAYFTYTNWNIDTIPYGIDYNYLDVKGFSGKIKSFRNRNGVTSLDLEGISLSEKSGFRLDELTSHILINNKKIKLEGLRIKTPQSDIDCQGLAFNYHDFDDLKDFIYAVNMDVLINWSELSLNDLSYFAPTLKELKEEIMLEGQLKGTVNDFSVEDFYIGLSSATFYEGRAQISGLPDIENTLVTLDIEKLRTSAKEIEQIDFTQMGMANFDIPTELYALGEVHVDGFVQGFYNDFELSINAGSAIGSLHGDFACYLDQENDFFYNGDLATKNIQLGRLLGNDVVGNFSSELKIDGFGLSLEDVDMKISGHLDHFDLLDYNYEEVAVDGRIKADQFNGYMEVHDANIDLIFEGNVDIGSKPMVFDFVADVQKAHLYDLNWINERPSAIVCTKIEMHGNGSSLDDFDGGLYLNDLSYYQEGKDYFFDKIAVESQSNRNYHRIDIQSKFADLVMAGEYSFDSLDVSLYALGNHVFPSLFPTEGAVNNLHENFDLHVDIHDLSMITALFYPELRVSPDAKLGCIYDSESEKVQLSAYSDWVEFKETRFVGLTLDTTRKFDVQDTFYTLNLHTDTTYFSKDIFLENFSIGTKVFHDDLDISFHWYQSDSSNWGAVFTEVEIFSPTNFSCYIHPSQVFAEEIGEWDIKRDATIKIDSTSINVGNLLAINNGQTIRIHGVVSENYTDKLNLELANFNVDNINPFIPDEYELSGNLTLSGYISDVYDHLYFDAYSWISQLKLNEYTIGNVETAALWNPKRRRIEITGDIFVEDEISTLKMVRGHYYVDKTSNNLDFITHFNQTDVDFANIFMPEGFSGLSGNISGEINLMGSFEEPLLKGKLDLDNTSIKIDMLNTSYSASGEVSIDHDMILLTNIPIKDKLGTKGTLTGSFFHQNFKRYSYDFFSTFQEPFLVMNTSYQMNPLYYGNAFATGDIAIAFDDYYQQLEINVHAKSEKGTDITLPLYGSDEVELQDFITFVNQDSVEEYKVDLEGINLNLSLDITEDAEIQLVFDDIVGDAMQGKGIGHIDMYIDPFYDFYMFGNYEIIEGSYLFTLKNIINKKFNVKKGGTINWYGDPYEADIDLTAVYNLKASLYDIMPESERESYRQKTEVETEMYLKDNLFSPNVDFNILVPRADENARTVLNNLVSTPTEMNKQVFSLLLLKKFLPGEFAPSGAATSANAGIATTTEMLSNQLTNMLSKFSDDFDIGFNYTPGSDISSQDVALALSTQLLDDRLTIQTNVGVSHQKTANNESSSLIGDVDVEYKLNEEGNTRVHAFNRSNEYDITQSDAASYTQGVGVFYQESFDNFPELACKVKNLFIKKEKECNTCQSACSEKITKKEQKRCAIETKKKIKSCQCEKIKNEEKKQKCLKKVEEKFQNKINDL